MLVIEDEARIVNFVRPALEAEGLAVDTAADGIAGLQAALAGRHDVVVLDLVLPGRDGLSVLERLRSARPRVPVVMLSGRAELATKLRGFELGATDYLTKPFSVAELVARVRIQLRRAAPEQDAVLRAGPLALDLIRRQVRHGDATFDLSDREFKLLRCLLTRAGSVVTREQLLADVWGIDFDPRTSSRHPPRHRDRAGGGRARDDGRGSVRGVSAAGPDFATVRSVGRPCELHAGRRRRVRGRAVVDRPGHADAGARERSVPARGPGATSVRLTGRQAITSPVLCVSADHPYLRFVGRARDRYSRLVLEVLWSDKGVYKEKVLEEHPADLWQRWAPSKIVPLGGALPTGSGELHEIRLRFKLKDGVGDWLVDDLFIDPVKRG